jgi:drug/metabolite transporter (DMT)-like permease
MCLAMLFWTIVEGLGGRVSSGYSPYQIVWQRYVTHIAFMLLVFGPRYKVRLVRTNRLGLQIARALLMVGMPVCYVVALNHLSLDDTLSTFWLSPLLTLALAWLFLKERISGRIWAATMIAFAGVLLITRVGAGVLQWHIVFAIGMALCFSLYQVMTRMLRAEHTLTNLFYTAFIVIVPLSFIVLPAWHVLTLRDGALMAGIGLSGFVVLYALDRAFDKAPVHVVAPFAYTQPVWAVVASSLFTRHLPNNHALLGALIVIGSGIYLAGLHARTPAIAASTGPDVMSLPRSFKPLGNIDPSEPQMTKGE